MSSFLSAISLIETAGASASDSLITSILDSAGISIGAAARRTLGMALPYVYGGVDQGLSANEIAGLLKEAGIGMRRQTLLGVIRVMRTEYGFPPYANRPGGDEYPTADLFRFAIDRYHHKYNIHVSVHLRNPYSKEEDTAHITLSSERLLTINEIDDQVIAYGPALEGSAKIAEDYAGFTQVVGYSIDRVFVSPY